MQPRVGDSSRAKVSCSESFKYTRGNVLLITYIYVLKYVITHDAWMTESNQGTLSSTKNRPSISKYEETIE